MVKELSLETVALMRSFEELCDLYPEILGYEYGGTFTDFRQFHERYFKRLLKRIDRWLASTGQSDAAERVEHLSDRYEQRLAG
jgi:hypothetical protein